MSSTNRGGSRENNDFYATPAWCVDRLLERVELPGGRWLEPCAGDGAIIKAVQAVRSERWAAIEIDEKHLPELRNMCRTTFPGDARERVKEFTNADVCITNPPFSIAQEILEACLATGALCVFLQRLNWCAGPRAELFQKLKPSVYVIPDRISFVNGQTDSCEYGWFVFDGKGKFEILDKTPLEIRRIKKKKGVDKTLTKKLTVHRATRANENGKEVQQENEGDQEMANLPKGFGLAVATAKASEGFEVLKDGRYVFAHRGVILQKTQKGEALIIEHEIVEAEPLVAGVVPNAVGTSYGLFLPMYGDAAVMLQPNLKAYIVGLLGLKKDDNIDPVKLGETIEAICGDAQIARGMLIKGQTYHKETKKGDDFMGVNWSVVPGENSPTAPNVVARKAKWDAGTDTAPANVPSLTPHALPSIPTSAPAVPSVIPTVESLIAQGWQIHPNNPAYMYRNGEAKPKAELLASL